jgi:hypothetical protein
MRRQVATVAGAGMALAVALALSSGAGAAGPADPPCAKAKAGTGGLGGMIGGPAGEGLAGGSGRDSIEAGRGEDCLSGGKGPDFLNGGRGDDRLHGGPGDDQLLPGPGADRVRAGRGRDLVFARDGVAEDVSCGPGSDRANADEADRVVGCEHLSYVPGDVLWQRFNIHINAYGYGIFNRGDGQCKGDARSATCRGKAEAGTHPFGAGTPIQMDWDESAYGDGQVVFIKAPQTNSVLVGHSDPRWFGLAINSGWVGNWVDPHHGVILTGDGAGLTEKNGRLQAIIDRHSFPSFPYPRESGYSLDLNGWVKIVIIR